MTQIAALSLGFFTEALTGVPTWLVALWGAAVSLLLHKVQGGGELRPVLRGVGWDVIVFMSGMFVVGLGLRHVGVTHLLGALLEQVSGGDMTAMRIVLGLLAGVCSAFRIGVPVTLAALVAALVTLELQVRVLAALGVR